MKKKHTANNQKCQPLLKNMSIIGTTLMISSSVLIPSLTTKAYADSIKNSSETADEQSQVTDEQKDKSTMDLNSLDTASLVKESANQFDMTLDLTSRSIENKETTIQISPNVHLISDDSKLSVVDETGKQIGTYTINNQLNKISIVFSDGQFTHAKLVIPASIKKFDLSEQVVTASIGESIRSKSITVEKTELASPDETGQTEQPNQEEISDANEENSVDNNSNETSETNDSGVEEEKVTDEHAINNEQETQENEEKTIESDIDEVKSDQTSIEKNDEDETTTNSSGVKKQTTETTDNKDTDEKSKEVAEENTTNRTEAINDEHSTGEQLTELPVEKTNESVKTGTATTEVAEASISEEQPTEQVEPVTLAVSATSTSLLSSKDQFIQNIASYAQGVASENGLYASVMIAQAILESGYGSSTLSSAPNYNLFGIKGSYNGQSVTMQTWEYYNGQNVTINAQFRKYPSYQQSLEDNARVLKTTSFSPGTYFYSGAWKANTNSYQDATRWLTGKYATDPNYNIKLNNLIVTYNLTQYDSPNSGSVTSNNHNNSNSTNASSNNSNVINTSTVPNTSNVASYTVKSGDTLYAIGLKYGVTVAQLKSWNNLTSDTIYIGQKLTVSGSKNVTNTTTTNTANTPAKTPQTTTVSNNNSSTSESTYTVKSGDTLYAIGLKYGVTVAQLKSWNHLTSDIIYVNQTLKLNTKTTTISEVSTVNTATTASNQVSQYTVKSGDTLYGIGAKYGVTVAQLKSWNHLSSDLIYVNQSLSIKNQASVSETNQNETSASQVTNINATNSVYTVKSGDTLYRIALNNHVSVNNLKSWNNLTTDLISIGQKLTVKQSPNSEVITTSTTNKATTNYTVKSGDSLYRISLKYGIGINELKQLNNLSGTMIYVGQTLKVTANNSVTAMQTTNKKTSRHSVKTGDSLWSLANKYGTSVSKIKAMNNLASDVIYIGQNLSVG